MELLVFFGLFFTSMLVNLYGRSILWNELKVEGEEIGETVTPPLFVLLTNYIVGIVGVVLVFAGPIWLKNIIFILLAIGIIYKSAEMFKNAGFIEVNLNTKIKVSIFWTIQAVGFSLATYFLWLVTPHIA